MKIHPFIKAALACLLASTLALAAAAADEKPAPAEKPAAPAADAAKAEEVLAKVREYYRGLKSFTFNATMDNKTEVQGMKMDMKANYKAAMQQPNLYSLIGKGDAAGMMGMSLDQTVVSDGEKLYRYIATFNSYTEQAAPVGMDGIVFGGMDQMGADAMLFSVFTGDSSEFSILKGLKRKEHLGTENVDGAECHKLRLFAAAPKMQDLPEGPKDMELAVDLWVEAGERPLIRKISPDFSGMLKGMFGGGEQDAGLAAMLEGMRMEIAFAYSNWQIDPAIPPQTFKFTPPSGSKKTDSFMDLMADQLGDAEGAGDEPRPEAATALEGKPAPAFKLPLLGGGEFDLAAQKGKVVVLDFWATWCGPCVKAMPTIIEVVKGFKDKGVVLVAVNLEESPAKVKKFLESNKLEATVALDSEAKVGLDYRANSIPETVIIGKDGVVKKVHVGFSGKMKEQLTEEIEAALAE